MWFYLDTFKFPHKCLNFELELVDYYFQNFHKRFETFHRPSSGVALLYKEFFWKSFWKSFLVFLYLYKIT